MNFQSFHFLAFYLVVLVITRLVLWPYNSARKTFLLFASYYFYMCWDWRFGGLIFLITLINYVAGPRIASARTPGEKRLWLWASVGASLAILGYFKYTNFFIDSFNTVLAGMGVSGALPTLSILLPVGVSFYTFQSISYSLDISRGRIQPVASFRDFALFVVFFPQLVAGPIVRAADFLPQLGDAPREEAPDAIESGFALMLRGFVKKLALADVLAAHFVDPAFAQPSLHSPVFLVLAMYAYGFQVYLDFSGYTDIARGASRTLGYELQVNFDRPYQATSISNFWQRWHISMSSFFRDYLYFGLGGSARGNVYVNLMITFVAIGVWHGAGWNFVLYGCCHAAMVCAERWQRTRRQAAGLPEPVYEGWRWAARVFWIFTVVSVARILFRGGSVEGAWAFTTALFDFSRTALPVNLVGGLALVTAAVLHYTPNDWAYSWKTLFSRLPAPAQAALVAGITWGLVALSSGQAPFIYFQF